MQTTPDFLGEAMKARIKRWEPLLEGIDGDYDRAVLATMLENQRTVVNEAVTTDDVKAFTTFSYPLIRRMYPSLIARELVSVQPMTMPTGKIFFLDFKFATDVAPVASGDYLDYYNNNNDPYTAYVKRMHYTRGYVRGEMLGTGDAAATEFSFKRNASPHLETLFTPVRNNANLKIYLDGVAQTVVTSGTPGAGEVRVYTDLGNVVFGTAPGSGVEVTADYDLKFEGDDSRIPEIGLELSDDAVAAGSRKLKARWTVEAAQDLRAYFGLNAESELTQEAAREIAIEIDREIIEDLRQGALFNINWSKAWPGDAQGYSRKEWDETMMHAIIDLEATIFKARRKRPNWIVTGPDVGARLEKLNTFRVSGDGQTAFTISQGPAVFGTLSNRWRVVVDPLFKPDTILMGHKGDSFYDTGYVYAPYVPLQVTNAFMDPNDWTPRKGFMTRYGKKLIAGDLYGTVTLTA